MIWRLDFPLLLTAATALTGVVYACDRYRWSKSRAVTGAPVPMWVDWCCSFFPILLLVWGLRSFVVQPYRVPSGSLEPTIIQGDFLLATQYNYGVFFPAGHIKMWSTGQPKRGDIALFYPPESSGYTTLFVKRVIGLPGDHVVYDHQQLTINGQVATQKSLGPAINYIRMNNRWVRLKAEKREEDLLGVKHAILVMPQSSDHHAPTLDVVVPPRHYFMMGDNRDFSHDSRAWGTVPDDHLLGKAWRLVMSWNPFDASVPWYHLKDKIRWHRLGRPL